MVTSNYTPAKQAGNGVIVAFNFSFKILAASDLVVTKLDANGTSSAPLVLGTDYTVTFDPIAETGTVTYTVAVVNGGFSVIARSSNAQQQTRLAREGIFPAPTVETMIDKVTLLIQELEALGFQSPLEGTGLYASKPATPTVPMYWYSTDKQTYEKWIPAASKWVLLG